MKCCIFKIKLQLNNKINVAWENKREFVPFISNTSPEHLQSIAEVPLSKALNSQTAVFEMYAFVINKIKLNFNKTSPFNKCATIHQ